MAIKIKELYDLDHTLAKEYLLKFDYPWEAIPGIAEFILETGERLSPDEFDHPSENVWIAKDADLYNKTAYIEGPCIIGHKTEVRPSAFIRGSVLVGNNCIIGNSTELKNAILFDNVEVPHYNYVGDSILGYKSHMGAGTATSNIKCDKKNVVIKDGVNEFETGLEKIGAMLGDRAEVGCNSVLNPGTILGKDVIVYPTSCVRGVIPENHIYKDKNNIVKRKLK